MNLDSALPKLGLAAAGLVAGIVLASTVGASAASPKPSPAAGTTSGATTDDPHPGDNGADGVPEDQEHHDGGHGGGHGLDLAGVVTAVSGSSVTIKTGSGTTTYAVTASSDIDKNGEATLSDLVVGDAVTFSVEESNAKQIDKLHAGDEAKDAPPQDPATAPSTSSPAA